MGRLRVLPAGSFASQGSAARGAVCGDWFNFKPDRVLTQMSELGGVLPRTADELIRIPGIGTCTRRRLIYLSLHMLVCNLFLSGQYTAGAISSIAFGYASHTRCVNKWCKRMRSDTSTL